MAAVIPRRQLERIVAAVVVWAVVVARVVEEEIGEGRRGARVVVGRVRVRSK